MTEIISFAKTNFRNQEVQFGIKKDDRRRHFYAIGKTGMGKTNMLENMAIQDIRNGHGVCFIDPHGDTAEKLIGMIPSERLDDVIYFNPADQSFPIAFNVMEKVEAEFRPLIASGLIGVFKKLWADSWGPRLEYILRNAILALLEYPGSTLLGVMRILVDKSYRKRVVDKITDPVVRSFWVDEFPKWSEKQIQEVISPIQNKVGQFLTSPIVRNIIGQTKSTFDVRQVMDNKKILILNLAKGRIGEDNSALIGAMIVTKIQLAAMERVDMAEDLRNDFYLYVDEFQNFATDSFASILSEARKYRLNLILANQYISQLDEKVRDAVFGNAGTIVSFRVGAADAEFLEKEFEPVFTMNDIVNLPKYGIYLKLMIDGIAGDAFSATTLPPIERFEADSTEMVIETSRKKYATSKEEAEEKIARLLGVLPDKDFMTILAKKSLASKSEVKKEKSSLKEVISKPSSNTQKSEALKKIVDPSRLDFEDKDENYAEFVYLENQKLEKLRQSFANEVKEEIKSKPEPVVEPKIQEESDVKINEGKQEFLTKKPVSSDSSKDLTVTQPHEVATQEQSNNFANFNFLKNQNRDGELTSDSVVGGEDISQKEEILQKVEKAEEKIAEIEPAKVEKRVDKDVKIQPVSDQISEQESLKQEEKVEVVELVSSISEKQELPEILETPVISEKVEEVEQEQEIKTVEIVKKEESVISEETASNEEKKETLAAEKVEQAQDQNVVEQVAEVKPVSEGEKLPEEPTETSLDEMQEVEGVAEKKIASFKEDELKTVQSEKQIIKQKAEESVPNSQVKPKEKVMYQTACSTCDTEIEVPFKPDGERPVFCRECLKDYQRAVAKAKLEEEMRAAGVNPEDEKDYLQQKEKTLQNRKKRKNRKKNLKKRPTQSFGGSIDEDVFISKEKPLSMSQVPYIAPKKFTNAKPSIDFAGVRDMIKKVQKHD